MRSSELWQANQDLSKDCLKHPFVQGIANGTLPQHCFAYYVGQDAFFLETFARAYSIAAAKAPDWEGFEIFHTLAGGVLEELHLHQKYAAQWGINLQTTKPEPATRRYTDFLLATAWGSEVGIATAAMTPCMRLYAFLGKQLAQPQIPQHQYTDWIRTYSSEEFEQLVNRLENLSDRYTTTGTQAETAYRYAMLCELNFFQAAWDAAS